MTSYKPLTREQMAWRAAQDLPEGAYVNLGIGIPTLAASYVPAGREVIFHSENGILGLGPKPEPGKEDPYMVDAGKNKTTLVTGGCFVHHADAFLMIRGGHLDVSLLGAFEVSEERRSRQLDHRGSAVSARRRRRHGSRGRRQGNPRHHGPHQQEG